MKYGFFTFFLFLSLSSWASVSVGGRLQGAAELNTNEKTQDLYMRRIRVNLGYRTSDNHKIKFDIRNDGANKGDSGEKKFSIGDAFYEIPVAISWIDNVTLFRAKVDISYSQTVSSKNIIFLNRASAAELAANFLVQKRRATNIQMNGFLGGLSYQLYIADGVAGSDLSAALGSVNIQDIIRQNLVTGFKFRYFFYGKKQELQETYYDPGSTLSLGFGLGANSEIIYGLSDGSQIESGRELYQIDLSWQLKNLRLLGEYFLFKRDLIDLQRKTLGTSWGAYVRTEYLIGKWAPYVGFNRLERGEGLDQSSEESFLIGINYYDRKSERRYGLTMRGQDFSQNLNQQDTQLIMATVMLDF